MLQKLFLVSLFCLVAGPASAADEEEKVLGGMSIVGNDEAPKSLAIVAWRSSDLGDTLNALRALDAGLEPVDKEVFMRQLDYYQIIAGSQATQLPASKQHKNQ